MSSSMSKFISQERKIQKMSDVEELAPSLKNTITFVSSLLEVNETTLESVFNSVNEKNINLAYSVLEHGLIVRYLNTENILKLIDLLSTKFNYKRYPQGYVRQILVQQGVVKSERVEKSYDEIQNIFSVGSIEKTIQEDDVDQFISLSSNPSFNPNKTISTDSEVIGAAQNLGTNRSSFGFGRPKISYMQLMSFFGSVKCFKHAISTNAYDIKDTAKYAIAGGNNEIIRILEQNGVSFDGCFEVSVKYHRFELCDWLLTHYKCEEFDISYYYYNFKAFFFLKENRTDVDQRTINRWLCDASLNGHFEVVKYLHEECHSDVETKNIYGNTPINNASCYGHLSVVKYLHEECHADVETKDKRGCFSSEG